MPRPPRRRVPGVQDGLHHLVGGALLPVNDIEVAKLIVEQGLAKETEGPKGMLYRITARGKRALAAVE